MLKYVVAQVVTATPAGEMTLAEVKEDLRNRLSKAGATRRYLDRLRKETFIVEHKDRAYALIPGK
jgi:hypothetical protein